MKRKRLGIRLDQIALLREGSRTNHPDPVTAAGIVELAGADLVSVHLREDRRHVQERDLRLLRETVKTTLDLRIASTQEMLKLAYDIKPDRVTLVPEVREDEKILRPLDVTYHKDHLRKFIQSLADGDLPASLFIDPDLEQIRAAHRIDATAVVLDSSKYHDAHGDKARSAEAQRIADAARSADKLGMYVSVGGSLDFHNIEPLVSIPQIRAFHVGHGVIARAVFVGLETAIRDLLALLTVD